MVSKDNITEIEREISSQEPLIVRVFLSWQCPSICIAIGLVTFILNALYHKGYDVGLGDTPVKVISLAGVFLIGYGLIGLANHDWSWGRRQK
ncbi:conserved hypothetical protein [Vibrio jasicida]|uniref:Uncharacterized protein n=1 Tax=Vibrio jasicida TaxID=766224 RepID=A0AAU9QUD6_9VIBR|nr:conserved hypothetical protein [Vibrio jasicida]CAH1601699.1 conserved hypothetical protein [Vibrio jasicida]